jgi:hypothetical protein
MVVAAGVLVVVLMSAGCVGPARTTSTYENKAVRTAQDSLSQLQTALLSVDTSLQGRMMHPYLKTVLSDSEDAFASIQNAFDSIQPPDTRGADALRTGLDALLSDGADGMTQLRVLARRKDTRILAVEAHKLAATAAGLDKFQREHAG